MKGVDFYAPLDAQSAAMSSLARSPLPRILQARLSGTFTDVVKGVVVHSGTPGESEPLGGIDSGFPQVLSQRHCRARRAGERVDEATTGREVA